MTIQIKPLTGSVAAAVTGVDLNQPLDDASFEILHRAFLEHGVLVFRGQQLQPAAQVAFARRWGKPVQGNPLLKGLTEFPELAQVTRIPKETASTEAWHSDSIYTEVPPKISILSAVTIPIAGDTMWCNQDVSYDRLSPAMQRMIEGLRCYHRPSDLPSPPDLAVIMTPPSTVPGLVADLGAAGCKAATARGNPPRGRGWDREPAPSADGRWPRGRRSAASRPAPSSRSCWPRPERTPGSSASA